MTCKTLKGKYVKLEIELFRWTLGSQSCGEKKEYRSDVESFGQQCIAKKILPKSMGEFLSQNQQSGDHSISENRHVSVSQLWPGNSPLSWGGSCESLPCLSWVLYYCYRMP